MGRSITKDLGGRPTAKTEELVKKLESIFQVGGTIDEACTYVGITRQTYYNWLREDESFLTKMEAAQHYADIVAKNVVVDNIVKDRDVSSAKWWLEKRQFKNDTNIQINEQKILVIPSELLDKYKIKHEVIENGETNE